MNYSDYMLEDFVADEHFIQWVKNPTPESDAFWHAWLSKNPHEEPVIKEARQVVQMLQFKEQKAPDGKFLEIWGNIVEAGEDKVFKIVQEATPETSRASHARIWYAVAAALLAGVSMLTYFLVSRPQTVVIQTAYGESRTLFLPDSTKVTLNANSTLRYEPGFSDNNREVWLDGEAFFSVVHKKNNQNFLVHTQELQVEVLGTRFNVNSRRGKSQVVLEEGKVKLDLKNGNETSEVVMQPGEMVEFSQKKNSLDKKQVDVTNYSAWRNNRLVFVSTSLEGIAQLMEDNYGYEVVFKQEELKQLVFTGSTSVDDPDELIQKLSRLFDMDILQEGNKLIIQHK